MKDSKKNTDSQEKRRLQEIEQSHDNFMRGFEQTSCQQQCCTDRNMYFEQYSVYDKNMKSVSTSSII